jgi:hypothetical protein
MRTTLNKEIQKEITKVEKEGRREFAMRHCDER